MYTPFPALPQGLRLATPADLPRIAEIHVLYDAKEYKALCHDPLAQAQYLKDHRDAFTTAESMYISILRDSRYLFIVAEEQDPSSDSPDNTVYEGTEFQRSSLPLLRIVVGFLAWRLPTTSPRRGQFLAAAQDTLQAPSTTSPPTAWIDPYASACDAMDNVNLQGSMLLRFRALHPSCTYRSAYSLMIDWGLSLCDLDKVPMAALAIQYEKALHDWGFVKVGTIQVPNRSGAETKECTVLLRQPLPDVDGIDLRQSKDVAMLAKNSDPLHG